MKQIIGCVLSALVLQGAPLAAQSPQATDEEEPKLTAEDAVNAPLFASHDALKFTIEAPFKTIFKERGQESSYHPAVLTYEDGDGSTVTIDLKVRTRGKFRLNKSTCNFPPIRLNFPRKAVANTIFAHQDGLKLVTHCQNKRSEYEQYVLLEYLTYRIYNLLTDLSLRARLAQITYVDTDEDRDSITKYGFIIEHDDMLAARSGWEFLSIPMGITPDYMDPAQISVVDLFNYMIGNTDFSAFMPPPDDDECCHNVRLYGTMAGPVLPVAYDFDFSGFVNARYAKPDASLRIRSVRQRLWRGLCRPNEYLESTIPVFQEHRDAIYALVTEQEGLEEKTVKRTVEFLDDFFEILDDAKKTKKELIDKCRTK